MRFDFGKWRKGLMIANYNNISVETENDYIKCKNRIINVNAVNPRMIIKTLLFEFGVNTSKEIMIDVKPIKFTKADTLLLLAIGINHYYVYCKQEKKKYEITFSYNFPIALEVELLDVFLENIDEITSAQLIALGEEGDFIRININNDRNFKQFKNRVDYIVRRNDRIFDVSYNYDLESVLNRWQQYCMRKFNKAYSQEVINAYKRIYNQPGFYTVTYLYEKEVVAQGVIFISDSSNTIYYCIFAWEEKFKSKSPGIYAYCKTIYKCFEKGYMFSFCYGAQKYKYDLLREFL